MSRIELVLARSFSLLMNMCERPRARGRYHSLVAPQESRVVS